ncbi:hypothetical protein MKW98_006195 [Papaver atlanticum]|uniref:Uncharacterized protein n=1 Tax=Papaver atlanticum TaxID=357466 RepID=A0AAD4XW57_9MAGN|nr:hypothetical protein MKW98_006195 [Papaver atlanticum]
MELEETGATIIRENRIVLQPQCISLFADGISLILSRWVKLQVEVANSINCWRGIAEHLRLTCWKVKHEAVEQMAADILAFFILPEEHCSLCIDNKMEEPCSVEHVQFLLHELMRITFKYTIGKNLSMLEVADKLFNLHQDFLKGKYDPVEELRKTLSWIGEDNMEQLRKDEELELITAQRANEHRKIPRRQRLKFRAYFV